MPDYKKLVRKKTSFKNAAKLRRLEMRSKRDFKKIIAFVIFGALIICAFFGVSSVLLDYPGLRIRRVSVVDEQGRLLPNPKDFFRLEEKTNLFSFDMKKAARDISVRHPELAAVFIRRQFPDTLVIVARRRKSVAIVGIEKNYSADKDGFILPYESEDKDLPRIVGVHHQQIGLYAKALSPRLKKALDLLEELERAGVSPQYKILKIDVRQYSNIVFYFANRIEVRMGEGAFTKKAVLLSRILEQLKASDSVPKYIDMRFDNPVVKPR